MYSVVIGLSCVATALSIGSVLVLCGVVCRLRIFDTRLRIIAISGWSCSAAGWMLLAAYLLAPVLFRALVR